MNSGAPLDPQALLRKLQRDGVLTGEKAPAHMRIKAINMICEGPSALKVLPADLIPGAPVLAVNAAVSATKLLHLPVHIWAVEDAPKNLWNWAVPYLPEPGKLWLWGGEQHRQGWIDRGFSPQALFLANPSLLHEDSGPISVLPTIFCAIIKAGVLGARRMRIFGADMSGRGSPFTPWAPWAPSPGVGEEVRWDRERVTMAHCQRQFARKGVIVERIGKEIGYEEVEAFQRPLVEAWRVEVASRESKAA